MISFGTLTSAAANQFGNSSKVTVNGANSTLAIGAFDQIIGHLDYQVGAFTAAAGTMTLTNNGTALTLGNNVTVNPGLVFAGSGSIIMSPFAGSNVILAGALDLGTQLHEVNVIINDKDTGNLIKKNIKRKQIKKLFFYTCGPLKRLTLGL